MWVKIHKSYRITVAICDKELIGKKFEEGQFQLDIRESFYNGEEMNYSEVVKVMRFEAKEDATFNIAGKESIKAAIEAGLINEEGYKLIQNIPYAIVLI